MQKALPVQRWQKIANLFSREKAPGTRRVYRRIFSAILFAAAVPAASLDAQPASAKPPEFDVASVRQNKSGLPPSGDQPFANIPIGPGDVYTPNGGFFSAKNLPVISYIAFAWKLGASQLQYLITQLPGWVMSDRFDIQARADGDPGKDQMRLMMRSLLADRFKLALHKETREIPVSAFVLIKPGTTGPQLRLHPAGDSSCTRTNDPTVPPPTSVATIAGGFPAICGGIFGMPTDVPGHQRIAARDITMEFLARSLPANETNRPIIDHTGLTGTVDFVLEWLPTRTGPAPPDAQPDPDQSGPSFQEALAKQLGIKLESQKAPMDVLVLDHIEHLVEN